MGFGVDMYGLFVVYFLVSLSNAKICLGFLFFVHVVFWKKKKKVLWGNLFGVFYLQEW